MTSRGSFLECVARDLWQSYGERVQEITMLFPSRRAALFFREELSTQIKAPMWSPQCSFIDQIAEQLSGLTHGDRIRLVAELYKIWSKYHPEESFDSFYFWGEMLITDFDTVDKYMIDADMLFSNLSDLHDLDGFHTLTPEQVRIIEEFWSSIDKDIDTSQHKKQFNTVWRTLLPIYKEFRSRLSELGIGYGGMIYRRAAERARNGECPELDIQHLAVVGMNALSTSEKELLKHLKANYTVDFYWDYDRYYVDNRHNEAGMFMRDNLRRFPPKATFDVERLSTPKNIRVVSTPSDAVQCKYAGQRLAEINATDKDTAVVLTDESLLLPMLYSLPEQMESVNITMGYPIRGDIAYSFCERLLELQRRKRVAANSTSFYHSDVTGLLSHAYLSGVEATRELTDIIIERRLIYVPQELFEGRGILELIFSPRSGGQLIGNYIEQVLNAVMECADKDPVRDELFSVIATQIDKLANSIESCGLAVEEKTHLTLLRKVLQTTNVPFEGEPLVGVQIMGFLESRALDFRNILILSMSDDHCPGNRLSSPSYIPYKLRKAYGMPTPEEQEAMYAYYFYRLLQRAENVELIYCSRTDERNTGEQSRYISQLAYESPHTLQRLDVQLNVTSESEHNIQIDKSGEVASKLNQWLDNSEHKLSHTRFFKFIECPLKFYFDSIARLAPVDELNEEVDGSTFGNILHYAMHKLYTPLVGVHNPREQIRTLIGSERVRQVVTESTNEACMCLKGSLSTEDWGGTLRMIRNVVTQYINTNILPFDAAKQGYTIMALEDRRSMPFEFRVGEQLHTVWFHGAVDRIDRLDDGTLEVIDYKTGRPKGNNLPNEQISDIETLFEGTSDQVISAVLQTLLYSEMLTRDFPGVTVRPTLYYVRKMRSDYTPLIMDRSRGVGINSYAEYADEFRAKFSAALSRLFSPSEPFSRCTDTKACQYCDFKLLCQRQ
ncbi:MAG: PD-(D/E)XK nuclease family protein [Rikenellaceae bacterium]|nr:PD-(D/E)XK nuclease family protein [Rikenellaceae bacterium]